MVGSSNNHQNVAKTEVLATNVAATETAVAIFALKAKPTNAANGKDRTLIKLDFFIIPIPPFHYFIN